MSEKEKNNAVQLDDEKLTAATGGAAAALMKDQAIIYDNEKIQEARSALASSGNDMQMRQLDDENLKAARGGLALLKNNTAEKVDQTKNNTESDGAQPKIELISTKLPCPKCKKEITIPGVITSGIAWTVNCPHCNEIVSVGQLSLDM